MAAYVAHTKKRAIYLTVNYVFGMEVLIWDTIFMSPTEWWSSEPQKTCEVTLMILYKDSNAVMTSNENV